MFPESKVTRLECPPPLPGGMNKEMPCWAAARETSPGHASRQALGQSGQMLTKIIYGFLAPEEDS